MEGSKKQVCRFVYLLLSGVTSFGDTVCSDTIRDTIVLNLQGISIISRYYWGFAENAKKTLRRVIEGGNSFRELFDHIDKATVIKVYTTSAAFGD
ncbi:hypothetical protein V8C35DRAFT_315229 [Trichoderma chlorosporum]